MGTRIVGINTSEKYVIQRYVLNPGANSIDSTTGTIHREKTEYQNMDWYNGNAKAGTDYQVFKLDKAVTGEISDIRLAEYGAVDITDSVKGSAKKVPGRYGEPDRLSLDFPATDKPIVVDIKIPYKDSTGGVGTGIDWVENGVTYWKSDYYERVDIIKDTGPVLEQSTGIQGSYVSDNSLDVTNVEKTFGFKLKKVKEDDVGQAIKGAEFKLTGPGISKDGRFMTTGPDGMISFDKLKPGTYKLEETTAAPGYEKATNDWSVRITEDGKVFIKVVPKDNSTNNVSGAAVRSAELLSRPAEENTILTVGDPNSTEEKQVKNIRLAKQMQALRASQYGVAPEVNGNSLVKSQAEINQDAIRQNINAVYGENNLENQLADGMTFGEIAMLAYNRDFVLGTNSGLEISDEIVPGAQQAGGWEQVDPIASTGRAGVAHSTSYMETRVTEINKDTDRFKQQFLFKPKSGVTFNRKIEIHRQPEKNKSGGGLDLRLTNGPYPVSSINVYEVDPGSSLDSISGKRLITSIKPNQARQPGSNIMRVYATIPSNMKGTILMEVEAPYADNGTLGLGADYQYDNPPSSQYDKTKQWKDWAADSYSEEAKVNDKVQEKTYTITTSTDNNGSLKVEVGGQEGKTTGIKKGEQVVITPQPKPGYELDGITINGYDKYNPNLSVYSFKMPEGNVNVIATFKRTQVQTYTITIMPTKNGMVKSDKTEAKENESFNLTIAPDPGYILDKLYLNNTDFTHNVYNNKVSVRMGGYDANIYATFKRDPNYVMISFDPNTGSGAMGPYFVRRGQSNFTMPKNSFTPPAGKIFYSWWYDGQYFNPDRVVTVSDDVTFYATWINKPAEKVTVSFDKNGGSGDDMPALTLDKGSTYKLPQCNFTPPTNQEFKAWEVNGVEKVVGDTITVNANTIVKAIWKDKLQSISVVAVEHGSITAPTSAKVGDKVTIKVNPDDGYELEKIEVQDKDGKLIATLDKNDPSFTMQDQDVYLKAFFKPITIQKDKYDVGIDGDPLRTVTVTPEKGIAGQAEEGEKVNVSVSMNSPNYALKTIFVKDPNGKLINFVKTGPSTGYFIMPASAVTVYTTLNNIGPGSFEVKIADTANGYVNTDRVVAKQGDIVTLDPKPNAGFKLDSYKVTNVATGETIPVTDNKFTMPNSAVTVSASFTSDGTSIPTEGEVEIPEGKFAQITNKQTGIELKIFKKNSADAALIGAVFELKKTNEDYTKDDGTFTKVYAESDAEGNVRFFEDKEKTKPVRLKPGKYLLTETKSPAGYKKPAAPWKLEVKEKGGQLVITQSSPKHTSTSYLSSDGAKAGDNTKSTDTIKYKSIIKSIDPVSKTFIQRIYLDTRGYNGKVNVQITPTTKREEIDTPSAPPVTISGGVKTAYRTTYKVTNPPQDITEVQVNEILNDYDLRRSNVSVVNTARWRPFDWGFDEDQINLSNDGVYFIDIEGFYDDNIKDLGKIELKVDFYGGEWVFAQRTFENGKLGWKYDKDIGSTGGLQTKRDAAYQQGMEALRDFYATKHPAADTATWFYGNADNKKYAVWLRKGTNIDTKYYDAGRIVLATDLANSDITKASPIQTSTTKADIKDLYSSDVIKTVPQEGMTITNEYETYNITFSKHAKLETDPNKKEDYNKNRLEGAVFKLQKKEGSFWYDVDDSYVASAFNGYFGFRRLEPDRYRLLEVTPPEGYKPIKGPLLEFTIKQIDTRSGKIINPRTKKEVDLVDLTIVDPYNQKGIPLNTAKAKIKDDTTNTIYDFKDLVKDENKFNIDTCIILSEVKDDKQNPKEIPLKEANYLDPETNEPMGRIISGAQGYISLEYKPGGYVAEYGNSGSSGGSLVDYVTSATAKNMGKILNETPGKGKVTIKKLDENGNALGSVKKGELTVGAKFEAIRTSGKKDKDGNPVKDAVYTGTVDENGVLIIDGLPIGNYDLKEVENPSGHINTGQVWHFTVGGKDLDPYAGDISRNGQDLTSKITLSKSELKVIRPNADDEKKTGYERNSVIRPHVGQSLEFDNEFKLDPNIEIRPGDYFVLKLTDNMDLEGVRTDGATNLDLFADGVGTIAKADYNKEAGTITYTFTKYAEQYKLLNFENKLAAHISLAKVRNSDPNAQVGISVGKSSINHDINIKYIVDAIEESYDNATVSLASKITEYNTKTGEFVHYFYVNRDRYYNNKDQYFTYTPNVDVDNLQLTYYKLRYNTNYYINQSMPESFAVNESDSNLLMTGGTSPENVAANKKVTHNIGNLGPRGSMIVKVTGKMKAAGKEKQVLSYKGVSGLYSKYYYYYDYNGYYIGEHVANYPTVNRWDAIYAFDNTNTASADLTISAINPSNKIQFKKVDPYGNAIKPAVNENGELIKDEKNNVKDAAYFSLFKNGGTAENPNGDWTPIGNARPVDKDGLVAYERLAQGYYKLVETTSPPGYIKPTEPVFYFKVDESGKIYRKITVTNTGVTSDIFEEVDGTVPIEIVNNKPIEFEKVDGNDNAKKLEGAVFKVLYKDKEDGKYAPYKVKGANNTEVDMTVTSGENGKFKLNLTKDGYYALEEIKAPKDYGKFPGYIKEFKLEKGKIQVLEKDPLKASLTTSEKGMLSSQILEVNEKDKTFKARLIINPDHKDFTYDNSSTELLISEKNWKIYPTDDFGGLISYAQLEKDKNLDSLKFNTRSIDGSDDGTIFRYYLKNLPENNTTGNVTTTNALVIEFNGKFNDNVNLSEDLSFKIKDTSKEYDKLTYSFDMKKLVSGKPSYIDAKTPIVVENRKAEYPHTGGMGTLIFTLAGLVLMSAAAYVYSRKRGVSYDD